MSIQATPERELVFDLNDFDETLRGPWEWNLKRLATSTILLGRANRLSSSASTDAVLAMMRSYCLATHSYARSGYLSVFYAELDMERVIEAVSAADRPSARRDFQSAGHHDQLGALAKKTTLVDGHLQIAERPPLVTHSDPDEVLSDPEALVNTYRASLRS